MRIHQVQPPGTVVGVVAVKAEVGILAEVVVVGHKGNVRAQLALRRLVVDTRAYGNASLEVGVGTAVGHMRTVDREALGHALVQRLAVIHLAAKAVLRDILPAPAQLRAARSLPQPLVGHVYLVGLGQVAEAVAVIVVRARVHRPVQQYHRRKALVLVQRQGRREVDLGAQFAVEVKVKEEPLIVRRLAVLHVYLARDGLVARRHRRHTLRHLYRVEPHAGRVVQRIGRAQAAHHGAVLVEHLRVGTRQAEHLDLPRARYGIAVTYGNRGRVLEALGKVAARHLAETGKRDGLALEYAVALDIVARLTLDNHALDLRIVRQSEIGAVDALAPR